MFILSAALSFRDNEFRSDGPRKGLSASWNKTLNSLSLPFNRHNHWQHHFLPDSCCEFLVGCRSTLLKTFTGLSLKPAFPGNHILLSHRIQVSESSWNRNISLKIVWKQYWSEYVAFSALCLVFSYTLFRCHNNVKRSFLGKKTTSVTWFRSHNGK